MSAEKQNEAAPALSCSRLVSCERGTGDREPCPQCNDTGSHPYCANGMWITLRCTRCQGTAGGQTLGALTANIKMSNAGALALAPCSALPETASVMVLEYEPRLTHSRWIDFYGEDHWSMEDTVAYLRQAVIDGKYVGWRILTIHKEVIGNDRPNNDSADMWTYSKYRASLRRNGHPFAIVTPDGKNALNENDIEIILAALNGNPPNEKDEARRCKQP